VLLVATTVLSSCSYSRELALSNTIALVQINLMFAHVARSEEERNSAFFDVNA